jgi:hypothetical protein
MTKAAGIWGCDVLSASFGANDKNVPVVQINVRINNGPSSGQLATYEDEVNARSAKYIKYSVESVGGDGMRLENLPKDVDAWIKKTGGKSTVEIKHIEIKNGKRAGEIWDKANSIGRGAPRVLQAPSQQALKDAADAMRAVAGDAPDADSDEAPF